MSDNSLQQVPNASRSKWLPRIGFFAAGFVSAVLLLWLLRLAPWSQRFAFKTDGLLTTRQDSLPGEVSVIGIQDGVAFQRNLSAKATKLNTERGRKVRVYEVQMDDGVIYEIEGHRPPNVTEINKLAAKHRRKPPTFEDALSLLQPDK